VGQPLDRRYRKRTDRDPVIVNAAGTPGSSAKKAFF
jgi:hypothetical protein